MTPSFRVVGRVRCFALALLLYVAVSTLSPRLVAAREKPNIVVILIDDMGYGDLSCTGNRVVRTPAIDRLAAEGTRFTQFYVASPICSPSRVGITTGQFPARHLIHSYLATKKRNRARGMRDFLDPAAPAIARSFQAAGYATAHFGKWHMGGGRDVVEAPLPQAYGFDESLVCFEGLGDRVIFSEKLAAEHRKIGRGDVRYEPKHRLTGIYVDRAIQFIEQNRAKPVYLHLWLNDVHDAHRPTDESLARFERYSANHYERKLYAVLADMDREIGRLVRRIDELGIGADTMVVLTSDNGPTAWKKYYREGLDPPGSTAGFRGRKWSLYEGGIRMPLIVRWPARIPAGRVDESSIIGAIDLFPTFCRLAGVPPPDGVAFDGEDRSAAFLGRSAPRRRPILWEYGRDSTYLRPGLDADQSPNLAIRDGRWKLLVNADGSRVELYDFAASTAERVNVAGDHPALTDRLRERVLSWRKSLPVLSPND